MDALQNGPLRQCCIGTMLRFDMRIWTIVLRVTATLLACMMSAAKPQEATAARAAMPDDMAKSGSASARNQRMWSMELAELRRDRELRSQKPRKSTYPRRYTYAIVNANPAFQRTTNRAVGCGPRARWPPHVEAAPRAARQQAGPESWVSSSSLASRLARTPPVASSRRAARRDRPWREDAPA